MLWEKWTSDEHCRLNEEQLKLIRRFATQNISPFNNYWFSVDDAKIITICQCLKAMETDYRAWLVYQFLCRLIKMVKSTRAFGDQFSKVTAAAALKTCLSEFEVTNLNELADKYNEADFQRAELFEKIVAFHRCFQEPANRPDLRSGKTLNASIHSRSF